jgi:hypothetical protein
VVSNGGSLGLRVEEQCSGSQAVQADMYFQVTLKRNMMLHPRNFGPKMREVLRANLKKEVEGTCNGRYGYIVLVTKIHDGEGFQVPCLLCNTPV